jgi:hypothetical protein
MFQALRWIRSTEPFLAPTRYSGRGFQVLSDSDTYYLQVGLVSGFSTGYGGMYGGHICRASGQSKPRTAG